MIIEYHILIENQIQSTSADLIDCGRGPLLVAPVINGDHYLNSNLFFEFTCNSLGWKNGVDWKVKDSAMLPVRS